MMPLRSYRTFQTLILSFTGLFLLLKLWDAQLLLHINQRFVFLVLLAALGMLAIAQGLLRDRNLNEKSINENSYSHNIAVSFKEDRHEMDSYPADSVSGWNLWWMSVPLILGILIPVNPLGRTALEVRGISTVAPWLVNLTETSANELPVGQRSVLDWLTIYAQNDDLSLLAGQEVDVTGFVARSTDIPPDQFLVGRFTITCCVADAYAVGLAVSWPQAASLNENEWVRVKGKIVILSRDGNQVPVVAAEEIIRVPEPQQPYLYP